MRVVSNYYSDEAYHRPDVVLRIVNWCNSFIKRGGDSFECRVAHQLKCMVIKRYSKTNRVKYVPLCEAWELEPSEAHEFMVVRKSQDPKRFDLKKDAKEIGPETLI